MGFVFLWAGLGVVFGVSWALRLVWAWFAGVFGVCGGSVLQVVLLVLVCGVQSFAALDCVG